MLDLRSELIVAGGARPHASRLEMVARGLTNPDIARVLGIGLGTVKKHVGAIIATLGVTNRTEAVGRPQPREPALR